MEGRGPPVLFKGERWNEKEWMVREPTSCKIIKMKKETNVLTGSYFETSHQLQDFDQCGSVFKYKEKISLRYLLAP